MINKLILLEGKNDLIFLNWLTRQATLNLPNTVKMIQVGGKQKFTKYFEKIQDKVLDKDNNINYSQEEIDTVLIIKDFDRDDSSDEFDLDIYNMKTYGIVLDKHYISGCDNPPQVLETLLIHNDGDLLKEFHRNINKFNGEQNIKLAKVNDKNIFEAYLKLNIGRIEYTDKVLSDMFQEESFLELPDIKKLIEKIREFIKEQE